MTFTEAEEEFYNERNERTAISFRMETRRCYLDGKIELDEFEFIYDLTFPYIGRTEPANLHTSHAPSAVDNGGESV
jgi:hypothetical protein